MGGKRRSYGRRTRHPDDGLPVDRGWAWMICLGAHVCHIITVGYLASLGVLYITWKEHFHTSATASSWLLSIPWLVACPICPFIGAVTPRIGIRRLSMIGGVVNGLSSILGSFATAMWQLYLCSVMSGIGMALLVPPSMILLAEYFKKRYALANGITFFGVSLGQMVFPPLIRLCMWNYGWRGAMFIIGAIHMNGVAVCALYQPLKTKSAQHQPQGKHVAIVIGQNEETADDDVISHIRPVEKERTRMKCLTFLKVFTNLPLMLLLLVIFLYSMGWIVTLTHLPARCKEAGWSEDQGAALLTVFAVFAMATRLTHGWFVDRKYVGIFKLEALELLGAAVVTFLNPVSDSYVFLVGYSLVMGMILGTASPVLIVIARKLAGERDMASAMGLTVASYSLANGVGSVVAGKVHDLTGDYIATYLCAGAWFSSALLLFIVILILKRRQETDSLRRHRTPRTDDTETVAISTAHVD